MSTPRVLLVEVLDAVGSDIADARERAAALRDAGAGGRVAVVTAGHGDGILPDSVVPVFGSDRAGLEALRAFARRGGSDLALVASASSGGGATARALAAVMPTRWWPTGIALPSGWRARLGLAGGEAPIVAGAEDAGSPAGVAWATVERGRRARGRFALWDGEYVLVPLPLDGDGGERILAGFARVAAQRSGLDLVVLSGPQLAFERQARSLGIAARVHFVGEAPREAEWAWWTHASAAMIAGRQALSGGLILRGLSARCPMSVTVHAGACGVAARWLEHIGASVPGGGHGASGEGLARLLARDAGIVEAVERGAAIAALHEPARIARRLVAALTPVTVDTRPAAAA